MRAQGRLPRISSLGLYESTLMQRAKPIRSANQLMQPDVQIEARQRGDRLFWLVRIGRRALTFHEELAARAFAAQLHLRLRWLQHQADTDNADSRS